MDIETICETKFNNIIGDGHDDCKTKSDYLDYHNKNDAELLDENVTWKDIKYQIVASNVGYLFTIHAGINLAFSNLLLHDFDNDANSWFASIVGLSTPLGACLCGFLMDKFGRKRTNLLNAIPCILTWLLISNVEADQISMLYFARFLSGIATGLTVSNMVYVSEISHKKYRPVLLSLLSVYFSLGVLLTTILQYKFTWSQTALIYAILFSFITILVAAFTSESPAWLINFKSDWNEAKLSLRKLNSNFDIFEQEWRNLTENVRFKEKLEKQYTHSSLRRKFMYKPVFFLFILFLLQQLSGIYLVILYAIKMFPQISPHVGQQLKNETFILFGILRFISSIVGSLMSIKIGRRPLLLSSIVGMLLTNMFLTFSTAAIESHSKLNQFSYTHEWMALISFLVCICFGTFGVMSIPWTLIVELLPTKGRSIGSSVVLSYGYALFFVLAKIFPFVTDVVRTCHLFAFFSGVLVVMSLFVYFFIPETLGKTFSEIEEFFEKFTFLP